MNEEINKITRELEELLNNDFKRFVDEVNKVRGFRINIDSVRQINIPEIGSKIFHVSNVFNVQRDLIVEPFEKKNYNLIVKSVLESGLGYKLEKSGSDKIYFSLMPLNQEIKNKIIISYKQKTEEAKISARRTRQKALTNLKISKLSVDLDKRAKREIDEITKRFENEISKICEKKANDLVSF